MHPHHTFHAPLCAWAVHSAVNFGIGCMHLLQLHHSSERLSAPRLARYAVCCWNGGSASTERAGRAMYVRSLACVVSPQHDHMAAW